MNSTQILDICAQSVGGCFCVETASIKIEKEGGKNLKFVSRYNYQFGEEEKEQYIKFKKESRKLFISNNTHTIIPSKLTDWKEGEGQKGE